MSYNSESEATETELSIPDEEDEDYIGVYIGQRNAAGERHGRGWAILINGDQYDGCYRHGRRHGIGLYVFKGGARYYGKYSCGHRSGRGIFIYPDGSMYEGHWRKSIKHGKGRYQYASGDTYTGDWYRGYRHGVGIYTHTDAAGGYCSVRFKGTWRDGVRVGPFEVYFGTEEKSWVLHGSWDNNYPQGPAVFSFDQRYMLMGYFQSPPYDGSALALALAKKRFTNDAEFTDEENRGESVGEIYDMLPSLWTAQDFAVYDYAQLPQEPVPLPLSDSEISICSLVTIPSEIAVEQSISYVDEGGEEGEYECVPLPECEFSSSEIETDSEPCTHKADPCSIEVTTQCKC